MNDFLESFDKEVLTQITKKQTIEAFSGLFTHLPPVIIEQYFDFCSNPQYKDFCDYLFLKDNYDNLKANELKRFYKLENKYINFIKDMPSHKVFKKDEVIEGSIEVCHDKQPEQPKEAIFIPAVPSIEINKSN
jgi:hypothetical protein